MRDRPGVFLAGDFDLALGDQRPGNRGAEQIAALVKGVGPEHGKDKVAHKLFTQVVNVNFARPDLGGLVLNRGEFLALTQVGTKGDDLAPIGLNQPAQDDRGVQTAAVRQNHFCISATAKHLQKIVMISP